MQCEWSASGREQQQKDAYFLPGFSQLVSQRLKFAGCSVFLFDCRLQLILQLWNEDKRCHYYHHYYELTLSLSLLPLDVKSPLSFQYACESVCVCVMCPCRLCMYCIYYYYK